MFSLLPDEVVNIILLNLDFEDLINTSYINRNLLELQNDNFWKDKYQQDFLYCVNYLFKNIKSWKEMYFRALNVNYYYPELHYELTDEDMCAIYSKNLPIFKSKKSEDLINELIDSMYSNCYGVMYKSIPLFNKYYLKDEQTCYEDQIAYFIRNNLKIIIDTLGIDDEIIIYMCEYDSWGQILTRNKDYYEITFLKTENYLI